MKQTLSAIALSCCCWFRVASQTPSTPPTAISASQNPVCAGQGTQLTVVGGSLGTAAQWEWYTGSCGGTWTGSGATVTVTPLLMTTYYVRAEGSVNTTSCASVTIIVNSSSTAPTSATAVPNPLCSGNSTTMCAAGGSLGTGASWVWYSGSCGGTFIGTGSCITDIPLSTKTYYVRAEGACNTTSCVSVTVTVNSLSTPPISATATPAVINSGETTTLSVTGGSLGTGASWQWYSGSCGGNYVGYGSSIIESPASTTTYYIRAEGTCNTTSCVSVTVSVNPVGIENQNFDDNLFVRHTNNIGNFVIEYGNIRLQPLNIKLLNITGQVVYEEMLDACTGTCKKEIDLSKNPEGIYMLRLYSMDIMQTFKILIP